MTSTWLERFSKTQPELRRRPSRSCADGTVTSSFPGTLPIKRLALFEGFDGRLLILGACETGLLFQPVNGLVQVTDIVLGVIPISDRLAVQNGIDWRCVSEDILRPPGSIQAAQQRAFRAVDLAELHTRITM